MCGIPDANELSLTEIHLRALATASRALDYRDLVGFDRADHFLSVLGDGQLGVVILGERVALVECRYVLDIVVLAPGQCSRNEIICVEVFDVCKIVARILALEVVQ